MSRTVQKPSRFQKAVSRALGDFHFKPSGMDPAKCKARSFLDLYKRRKDCYSISPYGLFIIYRCTPNTLSVGCSDEGSGIRSSVYVGVKMWVGVKIRVPFGVS